MGTHKTCGACLTACSFQSLLPRRQNFHQQNLEKVNRDLSQRDEHLETL